MNANIDIEKLTAEAESALAPVFARFDAIAHARTADVIDAFRANNMTEACLYPSSGYGYSDKGRDTLERVYADVFGCESAIVRHSIANGTHAIAIGLYGLLRPGDTMLSVTGAPYDTLSHVIHSHGGEGSLADFGINYDEILLNDSKIDFSAVAEKISANAKIKVVYAQRSRGYGDRRALTVAELDELCDLVHSLRGDNVYVVVDNCYGEFTDYTEPKADLFMGSLIKNPGGGLAQSGGYIAGTARAVELASYRLTTPGIGGEVGASLGQNRNMIQGFFMAPHTVAQAKKTMAFAAYVLDALGCDVSPRWDEDRSDIIETVKFGNAADMCAFCRGIQAGSPIDAQVTPEPWAMPGYEDEVIMAAGTFVQGSSIELSADGPVRPPYTVYMQGSLTYEAGRYGILSAVKSVLRGDGGNV